MQPRSKDVKQVVDLLKSVLPQGGRLNMLITECNVDKNGCGTVCCVGGWFAIALGLPKYQGRGVKNKSSYLHISYSTGADMMGRILGFKDRKDLQKWAQENQEIWGNSGGYVMFADRYAYKSKSKQRANNLQDVIDHWQDVCNRLYALENPVEITNPPVYIEDIIKQEEKLCLAFVG